MAMSDYNCEEDRVMKAHIAALDRDAGPKKT